MEASNFTLRHFLPRIRGPSSERVESHWGPVCSSVVRFEGTSWHNEYAGRIYIECWRKTPLARNSELIIKPKFTSYTFHLSSAFRENDFILGGTFFFGRSNEQKIEIFFYIGTYVIHIFFE